MKIKHVRLVLPARLKSSAQVDARMIAEAAAGALRGQDVPDGAISVQVSSHGRPTQAVAGEVAREVGHMVRTPKRGS